MLLVVHDDGLVDLLHPSRQCTTLVNLRLASPTQLVPTRQRAALAAKLEPVELYTVHLREAYNLYWSYC